MVITPKGTKKGWFVSVNQPSSAILPLLLSPLASAPIGAQTSSYRIARWLSKYSSSDNVSLDGINDIPYIIISDVWASRQTHANFEKCLRDTIHVCRSILITRLFVHRFPHWSCLYLSLIKSNTGNHRDGEPPGTTGTTGTGSCFITCDKSCFY